MSDRATRFQPVSWDDLRAFLLMEQRKINRDVDHDVRLINFSLYCEQTVEGFYLDGRLVGFARWERRSGHLSNIYVTPTARGLGMAKEFIQLRRIKSLYVMPHNDLAKKLYTSLGFVISKCAVPTREFMTRLLPA